MLQTDPKLKEQAESQTGIKKTLSKIKKQRRRLTKLPSSLRRLRSSELGTPVVNTECTPTVTVPDVKLRQAAQEEITSRKFKVARASTRQWMRLWLRQASTSTTLRLSQPEFARPRAGKRGEATIRITQACQDVGDAEGMAR